MTDTVSPEIRHKIMSSVHGKDTKPEIVVRKWLHAHGFRFRLHRKDLPGKPDIVLPKYRTAIFVHGCFWHRHEGCPISSTPKTNVEFWERKFQSNRERDTRNLERLKTMEWKTIVLWECHILDGTFEEELMETLPRRDWGKIAPGQAPPSTG